MKTISIETLANIIGGTLLASTGQQQLPNFTFRGGVNPRMSGTPSNQAPAITPVSTGQQELPNFTFRGGVNPME
jgi:bacteriocin-like protein